MNEATLITFIIYLIAMLVIGFVCYRLTNNLSDYILGGRNLGPGVTALSAGASDMSSWLLLGLPGSAYLTGMNALWITTGLAIGAYLNWQLVASRLRIYTEVANNSITIPHFLENRFKDQSKVLRVTSAVVILFFFTLYISSGMVGGAILFESSFGLSYTTALWIGAIVIVSYTFLGGFLAVSWTDFVQGILMFLALIIVPIVAIMEIGGIGETIDRVAAIDTTLLDAAAGTTFIGVISLLAWGLGYFGQPHILARFMAIQSVKQIPKARFIGMSWMILASLGAIIIGFVGIAYFADAPLDNHETVFIQFTQVLFHPWVAGFLLAAILAAIMSTIDSQLLVSSSAVVEDFYKSLLNKKASDRELVWISRFAVVLIALIAILLADNPDSSVLELVSYAWAGFGAAFGPVILFSLFWKRMNGSGAVAGLFVGAVTVVIWKNAEGGIFDLYEIVPGFVFASLVIVMVSLVGEKPSKEMQSDFSQVIQQMKQ
ncbi:sodium/proline symporter PutP [Longirhabdus pacifica]|uniref:sodium/proline symporter PutP n=1 Tax=Longirhabdus pacifica TaxID=2305227 RepID=UPI001008E311|nr:sodium/proline symporter PutP [Longirhabdus pacifica]